MNALVQKVTTQFGCPRGPVGWLVGHVMAAKNRSRGEWVLSRLGLGALSDVLEVGFGPGVDVARAARVARFVAGIDHSAEMVRQASRRNRATIAAGRVDLRQGPAHSIPWPNDRFDVAFSVNALHFSRDLERPLAEMRRVVRPCGLLAVAVQPLHPGSTEETVRTWERRLAEAFERVALEGVTVETKRLRPVSVACAFGRKRR